MALEPSGVYKIKGNNYESSFAESVNELLVENELIDVVLAVDNHLFNAHRLILSAYSPYFRQMFRQMPANQQAFGNYSHICFYLHNRQLICSSFFLACAFNYSFFERYFGANDARFDHIHVHWPS